jgi:hypothetical protein
MMIGADARNDQGTEAPIRQARKGMLIARSKVGDQVAPVPRRSSIGSVVPVSHFGLGTNLAVACRVSAG